MLGRFPIVNLSVFVWNIIVCFICCVVFFSGIVVLLNSWGYTNSILFSHIWLNCSWPAMKKSILIVFLSGKSSALYVLRRPLTNCSYKLMSSKHCSNFCTALPKLHGNILFVLNYRLFGRVHFWFINCVVLLVAKCTKSTVELLFSFRKKIK